MSLSPDTRPAVQTWWQDDDLDPVPLTVPSELMAEFIRERGRQVQAEGFDHAHDEEHVGGELLKAACCYLSNAVKLPQWRARYRGGVVPMLWPWDAEWWKPKDPRRDLVRAGALAMAEQGRLSRIGVESPPIINRFLNLVGKAAAWVDAGEARA